MKNLVLAILTLCLGFSCLSWAQDRPTDIKKNIKKDSPRQEAKSFLIGAEIRDYRYSEPGFVSHAGLLFGVWGEWYWASALGSGKTYGNILAGALTYEGQACKLSNLSDCSTLTATTLDIITKINTRFEYKFNSIVYLFFGGGYRFLYDKGEGASFYTRTGQWIYLPLGVGFNFDTTIGKLLFDFEYDFTVYGNVKSNLSEVSSTLNDLTSNQTGGHGLVFSAGMQVNERIYAYLMYESWNANDSDIEISGGQYFQEPANNSQSIGLRLGYFF